MCRCGTDKDSLQISAIGDQLEGAKVAIAPLLMETESGAIAECADG